MKLGAPTQFVFLISIVLAALGVVGFLAKTTPFINGHAFWFPVAGYVVLAAACIFRKM